MSKSGAPVDLDRVDSSPAYIDVTDNDGERIGHSALPQHGHNASLQHNVQPNPDLALHYSREHQHEHLHHNRASEAGRHDDVVYSKGTTFEKSNIPDQDPQDHNLHHRHRSEKDLDFIASDAEKATISPTTTTEGEDQKKHKFSRFYAKYRIFFHLFIWLVFTGYVSRN